MFEGYEPRREIVSLKKPVGSKWGCWERIMFLPSAVRRLRSTMVLRLCPAS